jgi:hypothetical protein
MERLFHAAELSYVLLDAVFKNAKFLLAQIEQIRAVNRSHTDGNSHQIRIYPDNVILADFLWRI